MSAVFSRAAASVRPVLPFTLSHKLFNMLALPFALSLVALTAVSGDWPEQSGLRMLPPPYYEVKLSQISVWKPVDESHFFYIRDKECDAEVSLRDLCYGFKVLSVDVSVADFKPFTKVYITSGKDNDDQRTVVVNRSPGNNSKVCYGKARVEVRVACNYLQGVEKRIPL